MKKLLSRLTFGVLLIAAAATAAGCTDPVEATRAANAYGFKHVRITGFRWTGCSDDDNTATGFTATNVNDVAVSGVVCSQRGFLGKSSTVRID